MLAWVGRVILMADFQSDLDCVSSGLKFFCHKSVLITYCHVFLGLPLGFVLETTISLHLLIQLSPFILSKWPNHLNLLAWITSLMLWMPSLLLSSSELFLSFKLVLHIQRIILISFLSKRSRSSSFTAHVSLLYNITLLTQASYNLPLTWSDNTLLVNKDSNSLNFLQAVPTLVMTLLSTPPSLPNISPK